MSEQSASQAPMLMRWLRRAKAMMAVSFTLALILGFSAALVARAIPNNSSPSRSLEAAFAWLFFLVVLLGGTCVASLVAALVVQTRLRGILQAAQGMLCPGCGYNLTGVESGECPECGRPYDRRGVTREWRDEYATALPPWPANPPEESDASGSPATPIRSRGNHDW